TLRIANVDARVAVISRDRTIGVGGINGGQGGYDSGGSVEAHFAVSDGERGDMHAAVAQVLQGLVACLNGAGGRDGHVVVGQQGIHGIGVGGEDSVAPLDLELIDFMAAVVFLRQRQAASE